MNSAFASFALLMLAMPVAVSNFLFPAINLHLSQIREQSLRERSQRVMDSCRLEAQKIEAELSKIRIPGLKLDSVELINSNPDYILAKVSYSHTGLLPNQFLSRKQLGQKKSLELMIDRVL